MLIPWALVSSLVVAAIVGAVTARAMGQRIGVIADAVIAVGLPAVVAARLAVIVRDAVLTGGLPPPAAWLTITAGLSLPVALVVALLAGARQLRRLPEGGSEGRVAVSATWTGLIAFAALSVVRGDALGIDASPPLGVPWPGVDGTVVPVGLLEALVLGVALRWARRWTDDAARLGAALVLTLAVLHLVGGALRPSLATVDRDLDVLLGIVALVLAVAAVRQVSRRRLLIGVTTGAMLVVTLTVGTSMGAPQAAAPGIAPAGTLEGAMVARTPPGDVPSWGATELAAYAQAQDGVVVVNLWASWCPPCHAEAPAVARAARALGDDVAFLGVLVDDDPARAQPFVDRYDLPFPTVIDDGITTAVGSPGLPTTVVLGADGRVLERAVGGVDDRSLAAMLQRAGAG